MRRLTVGLAAAATVLVGCSGDDDPEAVDTTAASVETVESTTESTGAPTSDPPTVTAAPTTSSTTTSTTSTSTTSTTTTAAPANSTDVALAAFEALRAWRVECGRTLPNCDTAVLPDMAAGSELQNQVATYTRLNDGGYALRNVESLQDFILEVRPTAGDPGRVEIDLCSEDGAVLVLPTATGDSLVSDTILGSSLLTAEMRLDPDQRWRLYMILELDSAEGEENSLCR